MRRAVFLVGLAFVLSSCREDTIVRSFIVHKEFSIVSDKEKNRISFKPGQHDLNGWNLNYMDGSLQLINPTDKLKYNLTSGEFNSFSFQYLKWNDGYPLAIESTNFEDSYKTITIVRHCKIKEPFSVKYGTRTEKYFRFQRKWTLEYYQAYLLSPDGERIATIKVESTDIKSNDIIRGDDTSIRESSVTEETFEDIRESLYYPKGKISECREYGK